MIYGCFNSQGIQTEKENKLSCLRYVLDESKFYHYDIITERFRGGLYLSKFLPYNYEDAVYCDPDTGDVILLSGVIYQHHLKIEQDNLNGQKSLPYFLFESFKSEGSTFVDNLTGDFVIVIVHKKNIYIFRDHLGIRPLSYSIQNKELWFSSDMTSLCNLFHSEETFNVEPLLKNIKYIDYNSTYNINVKRLLPGYFIRYDGENLYGTKYWYPESIKLNKELTKKQVIKKIQQLLEKSVKLRYDSRFKAATHLSGGLDSGIVAALVKKNYQTQSEFIGFSWSPKTDRDIKFEFDERELVKEQAKLNNILPFFIDFTKDDFWKYTNDPINFTGFIAENKVLEEAHRRNINLIFSGYGGDEFISKSEKGIDTDLLKNRKWKLFFKRNPLSKPKHFLKTLVYEIIYPYFSIFSPNVKKHLDGISRYLAKPHKNHHKQTIKSFFFYKSRREIHLNALECNYLAERIEEWYIKGFKTGVEYRYPLLDKELIEFVLSVPSEYLVNSKYPRVLIREISEGLLPEKIRWRTSGVDPVYRNIFELELINVAKDILKEIDVIIKMDVLTWFDKSAIEKEIDRLEKTDSNNLIDFYNTIHVIKEIQMFLIQYNDMNERCPNKSFSNDRKN